MRSLKLPSYFEKNYAVPTAIFATEPRGSTKIRPMLTIAPTATYFSSLYPELVHNFTINTEYEKPKKLAKHILLEEAYTDKTVIVCWVHQEIQAIAKALGVNNPPKWHGKDYSSVWVIDFNTDGSVKSFVITTQ